MEVGVGGAWLSAEVASAGEESGVTGGVGRVEEEETATTGAAFAGFDF